MLLTPREQQIVDLLIEGNNLRQTAEKLGIAYQTVKNHVADAKHVNECTTTFQLVARYVRYHARDMS